MSRSRIRRQSKPQPKVWWQIVLGFVILLSGVTAAFLTINWVSSFPSTYETAVARILALRRVVDHTPLTLYGGQLRYRVEAHVQYLVNGRMQDRWVRASDDLPQEGLLLKLAARPTECVVYWPPSQPENARCSLE